MTFREKRLRKRVYLKSPVRENRTPGSVGGQPGNRLSYPDVRQANLAFLLGCKSPMGKG